MKITNKYILKKNINIKILFFKIYNKKNDYDNQI